MIGQTQPWEGQVYTCVALEPYTRKDGVVTEIATWEAPCATRGCGGVARSVQPVALFKCPTRRCEKHKRPGRRVRVELRASLDGSDLV